MRRPARLWGRQRFALDESFVAQQEGGMIKVSGKRPSCL
jgi:hypothetical protein